jgi:hypothetical protein
MRNVETVITSSNKVASLRVRVPSWLRRDFGKRVRHDTRGGSIPLPGYST